MSSESRHSAFPLHKLPFWRAWFIIIKYKFTVVYCESVNLVDFITVFYLLIVARVIVQVILSRHASGHIALHV